MNAKRRPATPKAKKRPGRLKYVELTSAQIGGVVESLDALAKKVAALQASMQAVRCTRFDGPDPETTEKSAKVIDRWLDAAFKGLHAAETAKAKFGFQVDGDS